MNWFLLVLRFSNSYILLALQLYLCCGIYTLKNACDVIWYMLMELICSRTLLTCKVGKFLCPIPTFMSFKAFICAQIWRRLGSIFRSIEYLLWYHLNVICKYKILITIHYFEIFLYLLQIFTVLDEAIILYIHVTSAWYVYNNAKIIRNLKYCNL